MFVGAAQFSDHRIHLQQLRKTCSERRFGLIFVEFAHDDCLGKINPGTVIRLGRDASRFLLPDTRARMDSLKSHPASRPILAQQSGLLFTVCAELVIVAPQKRRLPVAHQDDVAHALPLTQPARSNSPAAPWPPPTHIVTTP